MHEKGLNKEGRVFLPHLAKFNKYYLAGGTALALQLGHRISVDFDFFQSKKIPRSLWRGVEREFVGFPQKLLVNNSDELTLIVGQTKLTFLAYNFPRLFPLVKWRGLSLASVREIAAMKAYTIGRRGLFKDYIDLYYIIKSGLFLGHILNDANKKYGESFDVRLFLEQLVYTKDIADTAIRFTGRSVALETLMRFFEKEVKKIKL